MAWLVPKGGGDGDVVEDKVGGEVEVEDVVGCGDDDGLLHTAQEQEGVAE